MWNLTSKLRREPSGKEGGAEASLRAGSHIDEEPASLTQTPQLWSNQGHHKTERRGRRCTGTLCPYLIPLGGPRGCRRGASKALTYVGGQSIAWLPEETPHLWKQLERGLSTEKETGRQVFWLGCHTFSVSQSVGTRLLCF